MIDTIKVEKQSHTAFILIIFITLMRVNFSLIIIFSLNLTHMHAIGMEETVSQNMFIHWLIIKEQQLSNIMIFTQTFCIYVNPCTI